MKSEGRTSIYLSLVFLKKWNTGICCSNSCSVKINCRRDLKNEVWGWKIYQKFFVGGSTNRDSRVGIGCKNHAHFKEKISFISCELLSFLTTEFSENILRVRLKIPLWLTYFVILMAACQIFLQLVYWIWKVYWNLKSLVVPQHLSRILIPFLRRMVWIKKINLLAVKAVPQYHDLNIVALNLICL